MATFPAYQNMFTFHGIDSVNPHFESCKKFYNATEKDITLHDLAEDYHIEPGHTKKGAHYTLRWDTYRGWKVYMWMTGCLASDPKFEPLD